MSKNNGIYYLVKEDILTGELEYFSFEDMAFKDEKCKGVQLSTVDALTTLFFDGQDLSNYLERKNIVARDYEYKYYIAYKTKRNQKDKRLNVIWEDRTLNAISKLSDGKIDFTQNRVCDIFTSIISEVKDQQSGLARKIITSKKEDTKLDDYHKSIIGAIASASSTNKTPFESDLMNVFSSYEEFRSLYLAYKEYHSNAHALENQLRKQKRNYSF